MKMVGVKRGVVHNAALSVFSAMLLNSLYLINPAMGQQAPVLGNDLAMNNIELDSTASDQKKLNITIYNQDLALISDERSLPLVNGQQVLAFKDVSARIIPETVILKAKGISLLEQNFEYDLLSPQTLLEKYVGKTVLVRESNPATGEVVEVEALVLSTNNGVMLKSRNRILQQTEHMQIIYNQIPNDLRDKPTLALTLDVQKKDRPSETDEPNKVEQSINHHDLNLSYLTNGLSWKADYVLDLVDDAYLNVNGWVTLNNHSGTEYRNANLQLVAGDLHLIRRADIDVRQMQYMAKEDSVSRSSTMQEENLADYHLYTLGHATTLKNNQTKQVKLLQQEHVPYKKQYVINVNSMNRVSEPQPNLYNAPMKNWQDLKTVTLLKFENDKASNLGMALPKGVMRVYQKDSKDQTQFVGEDQIDHVAENNQVSLILGNAFDITAKSRQVDYKTKGSNHYLYTYEVIINNAKAEDISVMVQDQFHAQWRVTDETVASNKINSRLNEWSVSVPAKSEISLNYTVEIYVGSSSIW